MSAALANAARLTAERPPRLVLLTGGASRMPFFREACQDAFPGALIVSCPEPEFSIAKGLAYAGWVDENLRAFRRAVREEITDARVSAIASEALPSLIPPVADLLAQLILEEAAIPIARQWQRGDIRTLDEMHERIASRVERVLSSPLAGETLEPAIRAWLSTLTARLQTMVDPICDRFNVPRRQMRLDLSAAGTAGVRLDPAGWTGLSVVGTVLGRDRERGGGPCVRRRRRRADRHGAAGLSGRGGGGRGRLAAGLERAVRGDRACGHPAAASPGGA